MAKVNELAIVNEARRYYSGCDGRLDGSGHIWGEGGENNRELVRIIKECHSVSGEGGTGGVIAALDKTDMYAIRISDDATFELMMEWNRKHGLDKWCGIKADTPNLCKMLTYCRRIDHYYPIKGSVVMELGGGNGQLASVMGQFYPKVHIDIDIPESLYMAYVCTRYRFPESRCLWVEKETVIDESSFDLWDFIFCPVGLEAKFHGLAVDVFVNTASMGEMSNKWIRHWMDFIQNKVDVKLFYGFNRFLNTVYSSFLSDATSHGYSMKRRNENEASVLFDAKWDVLSWEVEPLFSRCPYEDPKIARYLEIILRRTYFKDNMLPKDYLDNVKMEDWWRYRDVDAVGTYRSGQLVHDLTMSGPLFRLWNAVRVAEISDSDEPIKMMLAYLKHLGRGVTFEEEYYYSGRLR